MLNLLFKKNSALLSFLLFFSSCNSLKLEPDTWNKFPITIHSLSLFNQQIDTMERVTESWRGDWFLRRKRLSLVNEEIVKTVPNIILFQEMMKKTGNPFDSDSSILERSSLENYDSFLDEYKLHKATGEKEFSGSYLRFDIGIEMSHLEKRLMWDLGNSGYLTFQKILIQGVPLYIFNINMPREDHNPLQSLFFIKSQIQKALKNEEKCYNNIVVGGYFNPKIRDKDLNDFLLSLNLIDTVVACSSSEPCFTQAPSNPLFNSSSLVNEFKRADRIFVHNSTKILSSHVVYKKTHKAPLNFKQKYKLHNLNPSLRFGWETEVQFSKCYK